MATADRRLAEFAPSGTQPRQDVPRAVPDTVSGLHPAANPRAVCGGATPAAIRPAAAPSDAMTSAPVPDAVPAAPPRPRITPAAFLCCWLVPLLLWGVHWARKPAFPLVTHDPCLYFDGASSLVAGHGYRLESYLGTPPIGLYPPGQSMLLAPFVAGADEPAGFIRRGQWVQMGIGLVALLLLGRLGWKAAPGRPLCLLPAVAVGLHGIWIHTVWGVLSDVGFTTLGLGLLLAWLPDGMMAPRTRWLLTGLLLGLAYLMRTAAMPLVAVAVLAALWRFRRGDRLPLVAVVGCAGLAWLVTARARSGGIGYGENYVSDWNALGGLPGYLRLLGVKAEAFARGDLLWATLSRSTARATDWLRHAAPGLAGAWVLLLAAAAWALLGVVALGLRVSPARERGVLAAAALYTAMVVALPQPPSVGVSERYRLLLVPLFVLWGARGADLLATRWRLPRPALRAAEGLLVFAVAAGGLWDVRWDDRVERASEARRGPLERSALVEAIRRNVRPGDRVAASRGVPAYQLSRILGTRFVADYFVDPHHLGSPVYLLHRQQDFVPAQWLVGSGHDDFDSPQPGRRPGLPDGILRVVYLDPETRFYLAAVDPELDRAWRQRGH